MPWVPQEAKALPAAWPVCLRATGLLPLALVGEGEDAQAERLLYRLFGMHLAVLSTRWAGEEVNTWAGTWPPRCLARCGGGEWGGGTDGNNWRTARYVQSRRGTPCYCRRAR